MPPFLAILLKILPYIPTIVRTVEALHGSAPGQGQAKLATAISLIQHVVPPMVEHLQDAEKGGENTKSLQGLIGTVVAGINASKSWKAPEGETSPFPQ